jgi:hypothetical protein
LNFPRDLQHWDLLEGRLRRGEEKEEVKGEERRSEEAEKALKFAGEGPE